MLKTLVTSVILFSCFPSLAQQVQWASEVLDFSSEYSDRIYAAHEALDKPNVMPQGGNSPCSWAPKNFNGTEFIKVGFKNPMKIRQIAIAENFNPGAVQQVLVYDTDNKEHLLGEYTPAPVADKSRMFNIFFDETAYQVKAVKVVLNCNKVAPGQPKMIDAIGISDSETPVKAIIDEVQYRLSDAKAENLGPSINSNYDELLPVISADGQQLFFVRDGHPQNAGNEKKQDIWISERSNDGSFGPARSIGPPLNNQFHNFVASVTPDGNRLLLGNIYQTNGFTPQRGASVSDKTTKGWSFPETVKIKNYKNMGRYAGFSLASNGKVLLMTLKDENSFGGLDLYVSFLMKNGEWSPPKNIGPAVNTAHNDVSPFLAADGATLYFSSEGYSGYGKQDIFMTRRLDDTWLRWTEPQNIGKILNTDQADFYFVIPASGDYAYYASAHQSIGKSDIFRIKLPNELKPRPVALISGKVYDKTTGAPVQADIVYEVLQTGKEYGIAQADGQGNYKIILPSGSHYGFLASSKGYLPVHENLDLDSLDAYREIKRNLYLVPFRKGEKMTLNNVFFEFDQSELKKESFNELNRIAEFLKDKDSVIIELSGHTDNKGGDDYNLSLSQKRAEAVKSYLVSKGVPDNRLVAKGYGKSAPVTTNNTEEGRLQNRRVEFLILEQ